MKDTIDVKHSQFEDQNVKFNTIVLVLNGTEVKGNFDAMAFVGTQHLPEYEIEMMTCGCGVAGCAGIDYGLKATRTEHKVTWTDIDCKLPKKKYEFSTKMYDEAVAKAIAIMYDIAKIRETQPREEDFYDYDGILNFWGVEDLEKDLLRTVEWYAKRFK